MKMLNKLLFVSFKARVMDFLTQIHLVYFLNYRFKHLFLDLENQNLQAWVLFDNLCRRLIDTVVYLPASYSMLAPSEVKGCAS